MCDGTTSVRERLIDKRLEHLAVIGAYRAWRLRHVDTDDLFLGIYPEKRAGVTSPRSNKIVRPPMLRTLSVYTCNIFLGIAWDHIGRRQTMFDS